MTNLFVLLKGQGSSPVKFCQVLGEVQPWRVYALVHVEPKKSTQNKIISDQRIKQRPINETESLFKIFFIQPNSVFLFFKN